MLESQRQKDQVQDQGGFQQLTVKTRVSKQVSLQVVNLKQGDE